MNLHRAVLGLSLVATTGLTIVLGVTDPASPWSHPSRFMIWNLFLAWVPLVLAIAFAAVRSRLWLVPLGLAWLAFVPNGPYLVTDLVHLRVGYVMWRHVLQYGIGAWTGVVLAVVSMLLVHRRLEAEFGRLVGWLVVTGSIALSGVGVVIGRFWRWNSWDLVHRPGEVLRSTWSWVASPLAQVAATGVGLAVALFLALAYLTVWSLSTNGPVAAVVAANEQNRT